MIVARVNQRADLMVPSPLFSCVSDGTDNREAGGGIWGAAPPCGRLLSDELDHAARVAHAEAGGRLPWVPVPHRGDIQRRDLAQIVDAAQLGAVHVDVHGA